MNIYYLAPKFQLISEFKKKIGEKANVKYISLSNVDEKELIDHVLDAEIILISPSVVSKITELFFCSLPKLKHLCLLSSGFDWVDISSAYKHKITVSHCPGANVAQVGEYTWALILGLAKNLNKNNCSEDAEKTRIEGIELNGKTIGILGTGYVGKHVAKVAKAFDMETLGFNRDGRAVRNFDKIVNLKTLLKRSDVISINLPLTSQTRNLIDEKEIALLKDKVIIVNTSREEIVNKKAIINAVKQKNIYGYGLDANVKDSSEDDYKYLNSNDLIFTEKNAYNTKESKERMLRIALENITSFLYGKEKNIIKL